MAAAVALHGECFAAGQYKSGDQTVFVPAQGDPVTVRELDVLEQTPAGKGVDLAVKIRNAVFAAVGCERQTAPLAAGVAAVGAAGKDDLGAVRLRVGDVDLLIHGAGSDLLLAPWCLFGCFVRTHSTVPCVPQGTVPCVHIGFAAL